MVFTPLHYEDVVALVADDVTNLWREEGMSTREAGGKAAVSLVKDG